MGSAVKSSLPSCPTPIERLVRRIHFSRPLQRPSDRKSVKRRAVALFRRACDGDEESPHQVPSLVCVVSNLGSAEFAANGLYAQEGEGSTEGKYGIVG